MYAADSRWADLTRARARDAAAAASAGRRGGTAAAAFAAQPRLPFVILTFGLGMTGLVTVLAWLPLRITELGGDPAVIALAASLEAFAEVGEFEDFHVA